MKPYINQIPSPKQKLAHSQSPLHKKKFYKFVNDTANNKVEKSMHEQAIHEKVLKEPPREKKEDFKSEIERRFARSLINSQYHFPRAEISSDELSQSSQDSLDRLAEICIYDLGTQNLRLFAKKQKIMHQSKSMNIQTHKRESHSLKENRKLAEKAGIQKNHSNEPIKNIEKQKDSLNIELPEKDRSPEYRKILKMLDENGKETSVEANAKTVKIPKKQQITRPKSQKATISDHLSETLPNTADTVSDSRKLNTTSSPKHLNFSLNAITSGIIQAKVTEVKNNAHANNVKTNATTTTNATQTASSTIATSDHSIQNTKAASKSTKDLTQALQPATTQSPKKLTTQNVSNTKKIVSSSIAGGSTKNLTSKPLTKSFNSTSQGITKIANKKSAIMLKSTITNVSNSSEISQATTEVDRVSSVKSSRDSKNFENKSFASSRQTTEQSSSREQSKDTKEKLKKTATLYSKAQSDLLKKLKLGEKTLTLKPETPQGSTSINIQRLSQGPHTTTNKSTVTPSRNVASTKMFQSPTTTQIKYGINNLVGRHLSPKPQHESSLEMSN